MKDPIYSLISASKRIWADNAEDAVDHYFCFRREFVLESLPENSAAAVAADTEWALWINGKRVPATQYPCYPDKKYYTVIPDVKKYLCAGFNVIAVEVHHFGWGNATHPKCPGGLRAAFLADDLKIVTDQKWKCSLSESYSSGKNKIMSIPMGFRFECMTFADDGWKKPGFDDRNWKNAAELPLPAGNGAWKELHPRPVPCCEELPPEPVQIIWQGNVYAPENPNPDQEADEPFLRHRLPEHFFCNFAPPDWNCGERAAYYPINLKYDGDGIIIPPPPAGCTGASVIIDLGCEQVGFPVFQGESGNEDVSVELHYGEHLLHGRVSSRLGYARFIDTIQCGIGKVDHLYPFHRIAARYIQLFFSNLTEPFRLKYCGVSETVYPTGKTAAFTCSDPVQMLLRKLSGRTLQLCMHDHYEDCPMREQSLYAGDSRIQMLCGYYLWGNYDMVEASLNMLGERYFEDCGYLSLCAPSDDQMTIASYSFIWISAIREFVLFSGRIGAIRNLIRRVDQILEKALSRHSEIDENIYEPAEKNQLFRPVAGGKVWVYYEWCGELTSDLRSPQFLHQAFLAEALENAAQLHEWIGNQEAANAYRKKKQLLSNAANRLFWNETEGCYLQFLPEEMQMRYELVQSAAIVSGIAQGERKLRAMAYLTGNPEIKQCSWYSMLYLAKALNSGNTKYKNALRKILHDRYDFFAFNGATSLWEVDTPYGGSLCHGWSALPAWYTGALLLGVEPLDPGFRKFSVSPCLEPGETVSGEVPCPYGKIKVSADGAGTNVEFLPANGSDTIRKLDNSSNHIAFWEIENV